MLVELILKQSIRTRILVSCLILTFIGNAFFVYTTLEYYVCFVHHQPKIAGIIGPEGSEEARAVSTILSSVSPEHRLAQLGFSTTAAELSDRTLYPNFFRFVPDDEIQIEVCNTAGKFIRCGTLVQKHKGLMSLISVLDNHVVNILKGLSL